MQQTQSVYFAPFNGSGIGAWVSTTSYPQPVREESCVASDSYIYCIGGYGSKDTYFAPITQDCIGQWKQTVTYPVSSAVNSPSCDLYSGVIYCVGGYNGGAISNLVYATKATSVGLGPFVILPAYPYLVWAGSCVIDQDTIFCVGGGSRDGTILQSVRYLTGSGAPGSATSSASSSTASLTTTAQGSSGAGSIPEYPPGIFASVSLGALVIFSYFVVRRNQER